MNIKKMFRKSLPAVAIAGCVAGPILASRATYKAHDILADENASMTNKVKQTWKYYIPAVVVGGTAVLSIVMSKRLDAKEIAALTATCGYLASNKAELEKAIKEKFGDEAFVEIRKEVDKKMVEKYGEKQKMTAELTGKGDLLCYEGLTGRFFRSSEEAVKEAIKKINDEFKNGNYIYMNMLYDELGISVTRFGNELGWVPDEDYYDYEKGISITTDLVEGWLNRDGVEDEPVLVIDIWDLPIEHWYEY